MGNGRELTRDEWRDLMVELLVAAREGDREGINLYSHALAYHDEYLREQIALSHPEQNPANCPTCGDYRQRDLSSAEFPCRDPWHRLPACPSCGSTDPQIFNDPCDGWGDIDVAQEPDAWHVSLKEGER